MRRVSLLGRTGPSTPAALIIARVCQVDRSAADALVTRLGVLPRAFEDADAQQLVEALRGAQVEAEVITGPPTAQRRCARHPSLESSDACQRCSAPICVVCVNGSARMKCVDCLALERRKRAFRNVRVAVLVAVLLGIGLWALARQLRLDRRTQWQRPLVVSVVLVTTAQPSSAVVSRWATATEALTHWFTREWSRYRPPSESPLPVRFLLERVAVVDTLPVAPENATSAVALEQALFDIDASVDLLQNDATVYVVLSSQTEKSARVEGIGEAGGRRGLIFAAQNATDVTLESVALAHEFLHCLGARDKYDAAGHALAPQGLPAPMQEPLYPQKAAEVMVGELATGPASGEAIRSLDQVEIGPVTAREIHWR